jgi:hypothetical protein
MPRHKGPLKHQSPEDLERALTTIILEGGTTAAARKLRIPRQTLDDWKRRYETRFLELRDELIPEINRRVAAESEDFIRRAHSVRLKALERTAQKLDAEKLSARDAGSVVRDISSSVAVTRDKVLAPLRHEPSQITEERPTLDQIFVRLAALGVEWPGSEQLVVDAEVVEDAALPKPGEQT